MQATSDNPQFAEAMAKLEADDAKRQSADFTLTDLQGKAWHLQELRGKVVLVNFWATWCPPCRKEMPDLDALYGKFKDQGFVVLAISDEEAAKVSPYHCRAQDQLSRAARSRAQGERPFHRGRDSRRVSSTTAAARWWRSRSTCAREASFWQCCRGCRADALPERSEGSTRDAKRPGRMRPGHVLRICVIWFEPA